MEMKLLNSNEAAQMLDVTPGTLSVWRATRRYPLKFVKVGRKVRYLASDIEEFLRSRTQSGVVEQPKPRRSRKSRAA